MLGTVSTAATPLAVFFADLHCNKAATSPEIFHSSRRSLKVETFSNFPRPVKSLKTKYGHESVGI